MTPYAFDGPPYLAFCAEPDEDCPIPGWVIYLDGYGVLSGPYADEADGLAALANLLGTTEN